MKPSGRKDRDKRDDRHHRPAWIQRAGTKDNGDVDSCGASGSRRLPRGVQESPPKPNQSEDRTKTGKPVRHQPMQQWRESRGKHSGRSRSDGRCSGNGAKEPDATDCEGVDDDSDDDFLRVSPALQKRLDEHKARMSQQIIAQASGNTTSLYVDPENARFYRAPRAGHASELDRAVTLSLKRHLETVNNLNNVSTSRVKTDNLMISGSCAQSKDGLQVNSSDSLKVSSSEPAAALEPQTNQDDLCCQVTGFGIENESLCQSLKARKTARNVTRCLQAIALGIGSAKNRQEFARPQLISINVAKEPETSPSVRTLQCMHWCDLTQTLCVASPHTATYRVSYVTSHWNDELRFCLQFDSSSAVRSRHHWNAQRQVHSTFDTAPEHQASSLLKLETYFPDVVSCLEDAEVIEPKATSQSSRNLEQTAATCKLPHLYAKLLHQSRHTEGDGIRTVAMERWSVPYVGETAFPVGLKRWIVEGGSQSDARREFSWAALSTVTNRVDVDAMFGLDAQAVVNPQLPRYLQGAASINSFTIIGQSGGYSDGAFRHPSVIFCANPYGEQKDHTYLRGCEEMFTCTADASLRRGQTSGEVIAGVNHGIMAVRVDTGESRRIVQNSRTPDTFSVAVTTMNPCLVLSGHRDGTVRLYDLRKPYPRSSDSMVASTDYVARFIAPRYDESRTFTRLNMLFSRYFGTLLGIRNGLLPYPPWFYSHLDAEHPTTMHDRSGRRQTTLVHSMGMRKPFIFQPVSLDQPASITWVTWREGTYGENTAHDCQVVCTTSSGRAALLDLRTVSITACDGSAQINVVNGQPLDEAWSKRDPGVIHEFTRPDAHNGRTLGVGLGRTVGTLCGQDYSSAAFGSEDGCIRIYNLDTAELLNELILAEEVYVDDDWKKTLQIEQERKAGDLFQTSLHRELRVSRQQTTNPRFHTASIEGGVLLDRAGDWKWGSVGYAHETVVDQDDVFELPSRLEENGDGCPIWAAALRSATDSLSASSADAVRLTQTFSRPSSVESERGALTVLSPIKSLAWSASLRGLFVGRDSTRTGQGSVAFVTFA